MAMCHTQNIVPSSAGAEEQEEGTAEESDEGYW